MRAPNVNSNRNKVKSWFLTYPHSGDTTPDGFIDLLFTPRERMIEGWSGCKETHENGEPHLHANVKLKHGISKANLLNRMRQIFPETYKRIDIRPTRQHYGKADYLFKEDLHPVEWTNPDFKEGGI